MDGCSQHISLEKGVHKPRWVKKMKDVYESKTEELNDIHRMLREQLNEGPIRILALGMGFSPRNATLPHCNSLSKP